MSNSFIASRYFGNLTILFVATGLLFFSSCKKPEDTPEEKTGKIVFHFTQYNEGAPQRYDTMKYVNAAGNHYLVSEIQYFVSDVKLHRADGGAQLLDQWEDIHYVDTDLEDTQEWKVYDPVEAGDYDKITFTFGICEEKNQSLMFLNPPERDMFWPEYLGGGYHYMKLNGKWLSSDGMVKPFNFHLGIGQIYAGGVIDPDSITGFVQNYFEVELPASSFSINAGETKEFEIRMNVENWFQHPHVYDHDVWGGDIMQKQDAMKLGCENGKEDVFSFGEWKGDN
jgi:hypothetical protein